MTCEDACSWSQFSTPAGMFSYPFLTYSLGLTPIHWAFNTFKLHVTNTRPFFLNYFLFFYMLYSTFCPLPFFLSQIIFPPPPRLVGLSSPYVFHLRLGLSTLTVVCHPCLWLQGSSCLHLIPASAHMFVSHGRKSLSRADCSTLSILFSRILTLLLFRAKDWKTK